MLNSKNEIFMLEKLKIFQIDLKSYICRKKSYYKNKRMLSQTKKIEITTTSNESEALLLEANFNKKI